MTLNDIITIAKHSELHQLSIKKDDAAITSFINLGLIELYSMFALKTEEVIIELEDNVTIYDLPDNFMYMTGAYEELPKRSDEYAAPLPINEEENPFSVNTINYSQVQIPLTVKGGYISIIYVPKPVKLTSDDLTQELPVPDQFITPLLNFVAYKSHSSVQNEGQSESNVYYRRFLESVERVKSLGVGITADDLSMAARLRSRGFI